ncbi:DUF4145 domain-containing protein [Chromobacterium violaceum]
MARIFDRNLWLSCIEVVDHKPFFPDWTCFTCEDGSLRLDNESGFQYWEDVTTARQMRDIPIDAYRLYFKAILRCDKCGECAMIAGDGFLDHSGDPEDGSLATKYVPFLRVRSFYPAPPIINLPVEVKETDFDSAVKQAFTLFWVDEASCANKIRLAVEYFLEFPPYSVSRERVGGGYKRLNGRLQEIIDSHPDAYQRLMALKWLGNTGSHEAVVERRDLVDAFEVLDFMLNETFILPRARDEISQKVRALDVKHNPIKRQN